jgi:DNA polymerase III alpha subunit
VAQWYLDVFGENYYLEIQKHNYAEFVNKTMPTELVQELTKLSENEEKLTAEFLSLAAIWYRRCCNK